MQPAVLLLYWVAISIVGFFVCALQKKNTSAGGQFLLIVLIVLGGSAGVLAAMLTVNRKSKKDDMLSRVFAICVFILQLLIFLRIRGVGSDGWNWNLVSYLTSHRILVWLLVLMNLATFVVFAVDKAASKRGGERIPIVVLLGLSFLGGSVGGMIAMYTLRHKTQKPYFTIGMPLILLTQIAVLLFVMNL